MSTIALAVILLNYNMLHYNVSIAQKTVLPNSCNNVRPKIIKTLYYI